LLQFFGASSFASAFGDSDFSAFGGSMGGGGGFPSMFGNGSRMDPFGRMTPSKASAIERYLPCSLEDLYNGKQRKMKITRTIFDVSG